MFSFKTFLILAVLIASSTAKSIPDAEASNGEEENSVKQTSNFSPIVNAEPAPHNPDGASDAHVQENLNSPQNPDGASKADVQENLNSPKNPDGASKANVQENLNSPKNRASKADVQENLNSPKNPDGASKAYVQESLNSPKNPDGALKADVQENLDSPKNPDGALKADVQENLNSPKNPDGANSPKNDHFDRMPEEIIRYIVMRLSPFQEILKARDISKRVRRAVDISLVNSFAEFSDIVSLSRRVYRMLLRSHSRNVAELLSNTELSKKYMEFIFPHVQRLLDLTGVPASDLTRRVLGYFYSNLSLRDIFDSTGIPRDY